MIYTIERKLSFDAAHRLVNHSGKCQYLHGHRYTVTVSISSSLDAIGRVIDFSVVKDYLGKWIEENWDHNTILNAEDKTLIEGVLLFCKPPGPYLLAYNPTAENLAKHLLMTVCPLLFAESGVTVKAIRIDETPNCSAIVEEE